MYSGSVSLSHAFLGLLADRPRHGYELKRRYDTIVSPGRPLPFGQVYATLARLERVGQVAVSVIEREKGPDRSRYAITQDGRFELERWLAEPVEPEPYLQSALFMKVAIAALGGQSIEAVLDRQRRAHLARMRELTEVKRTSALPVALLADYALFHLEADLRWIEMTGARVDDLRARVMAVRSSEPSVEPR